MSIKNSFVIVSIIVMSFHFKKRTYISLVWVYLYSCTRWFL